MATAARILVGTTTDAGILSERPIAAGSSAATPGDSQDRGAPADGRTTRGTELAAWRGNGDGADDRSSEVALGARSPGVVSAQEATAGPKTADAAPTSGPVLGKRTCPAPEALGQSNEAARRPEVGRRNEWPRGLEAIVLGSQPPAL